ncbi:hypothetical protein [Coleofasciculus sp. G2-EDA-02]|uniref:hypothetical protein n=1 Tax=Coleofasciculus sp. G2-EDA-02 TaxID=3069529 RepID=UPI0033018B4B
MVKPVSSQCDATGGSLCDDCAAYCQASQRAITTRSFNILTWEQSVEPLTEESVT